MRWAFLLGLISIAACAPVEMQERASRPTGEGFASVGDVVIRVELRDNLPNVFGRADIYGRTRDRGFAELRYLGIAPNGMPAFRRREVDIQTNETVFSRMPNMASVQAQSSGALTGTPSNLSGGSSFQGSGFAVAPTAFQQAAMQEAGDFTLDLSAGRTITLRGRAVDILDANPSGVRFVIR